MQVISPPAAEGNEKEKKKGGNISCFYKFFFLLPFFLREHLRGDEWFVMNGWPLTYGEHTDVRRMSKASEQSNKATAGLYVEKKKKVVE